MKKIFLVLMPILLITGTAFALRQVSLSNTIMRQTDIRIHYNEAGEAMADLTVVYDVCDTDCNFIKEVSRKVTWDQLPAAVQSSLITFLSFVDKGFRNATINEDNSDMVFSQ